MDGSIVVAVHAAVQLDGSTSLSPKLVLAENHPAKKYPTKTLLILIIACFLKAHLFEQ